MKALALMFPIDLAREPKLIIAGMEVRPATRQIVFGGTTKTLEPRVMQVLVALGRRRGEVVSRNDLNALCWGGRIVSEDAINRCIQAIRKLAQTQGGFAVTTVPRVGYRLDEMAAPRSTSSLSGRELAIVVMPFANLSGDPTQDYLANALATEIAGALLRYKSLAVSVSLRRPPSKDGDAVRQLGIRYVLGGSILPAGARVRINVQLTDVEQDVQIWAQRSTEPLSDIFDMLDRVALGVAARIETLVLRTEIRRAVARPAEELGACEAYLQARSLLSTCTEINTRRALELLTRVIALDGDFAPAMSVAAMCHYYAVLYGWSADPDSSRRAGVALALRALRTAGDDADVAASAGAVLVVLGGDHDAGAALVQHATVLNPGHARAWLTSGMVQMRAGRSELAVEHIETSMRPDPTGPWRPDQIQIVAMARFQQRRFAEAVPLMTEVIHHMESPVAYAVLAASCAFLQRRSAAKRALAVWKSTSPLSSTDFAQSVFPQRPHIEQLVEGMELAEK